MLNPQGHVDMYFRSTYALLSSVVGSTRFFSDDDDKLICVETSCRLKTCPLADAMNNKKHRKYKDKNIRKYVLI